MAKENAKTFKEWEEDIVNKTKAKEKLKAYLEKTSFEESFSDHFLDEF